LIHFFLSSPFVSPLLHIHSSLYSSHTAFRLSSRFSRSSIQAAKKFQKWFCSWNALPFRLQHDKGKFGTAQTARPLGCFTGTWNAWRGLLHYNEKWTRS